jgi:cardiolipin synthase
MARQQRRRRTSFRRRLHGGLISVLAGCQVLPAPVPACRHPDTILPRTAVAVRQVAIDTAVEVGQRPLRTLGSALIEPAIFVGQAGPDLRKRLNTCLGPSPDPIVECRPAVDADALEADLHRAAGDELEPACIQLLADGQEALDALEDALAQATCQIDVLMYLWDNDPLGWEIAHKLAARASPTLRVRVIIDGGGNLLQGEPKSAGAAEVNAVVCWLAQQPYVQVIRGRTPCFRLDHRKLVIIDGRLVWSGGRNFTHEAFFRAHDLSYLLSGPLTGELAARFESRWREYGGPPGPPLPPPELPAANTLARLVRTRPFEANLAHTVYTAVDRAQHHIYVENPYFTDDVLFNKLVQARQRGVDVRVVITLDSGSWVIDLANRMTVNRLLRAGIRVYLYPGMTHVKALSIDGVWAYFGTGNFDALSLRHNRELGVAISHGTLVGELEERVFRTDFRPEWEVHQPLPCRPGQRTAELLANWFL